MSTSPSSVTNGPTQPHDGSGADGIVSAAYGDSIVHFARPTPLVVNLSKIKNIPEGYRVMESTGNVIPQSMHSSSQSARKIYVIDGKELEAPLYPKASSESTFDSQAIPGTEPDDEPDEDVVPPPENPRKVARRERRLVRVKASCEGCNHDPPFGHPSQRYHMSFGGCMDPDKPADDSDVSSNMSNDDDDDDPFPSPQARAGKVKRCLECSLVKPLDNSAKRAKILVPETPLASRNPAVGSSGSSGVIVPETPMGVNHQERASKLARALDRLIGYAVDKLGGDIKEIESLIDEAIGEE
jgi:hypothetical protein